MPGTPVRDVAEHVEGERAEPGSEAAPGAAIPQRCMRLPTGERARAAWVGAGLLTMLTVPLIVALVVLSRRTWYPILDLAHFELMIPQYLEKLEESLIEYLAELGITSEPGGPGLTGVWTRGEKVAAIGIKLNRSVVSHGFALNLTTDLEYFDGIIPCGHAEKRPTSVEELTGHRISTEDAALDYARHFERIFDAEMIWVPSE